MNKSSRQTMLERALQKIEELESRLEPRSTVAHDGIAVVGMGLRFPRDIRTVEDFWARLLQRYDAIIRIPGSRGGLSFDGLEGGARWAGLIDDFTGFDPAFFGLSPREARLIDPQQRLLLEVVWEALEHAGIRPSTLHDSRTGVFVGMSTGDFESQVDRREQIGVEPHVATGVARCFAAGRISHTLGLRGPAIVVDTACSSSHVAVHLACQSLRNGESSLAIAAGVNLILDPLTSRKLAAIQALSPNGRCHPFDARANGFVRAEGVGALVLRRLSEARRLGERVWCVIKGSALNHDGRSAGLTAPNPLAQRDVLTAAMRDAGVRREQVAYIEAHGTGTNLGDPIEFEGIEAAYGSDDAPLCIIGSVKSNLGHLEAGAGMPAIIKTALALVNAKIPPDADFERSNPRVGVAGTRFRFADAARPWPSTGGPRVAGVSGFGLSGTNVHLLLEQAPAADDRGQTSRSVFVFPVSAREGSTLDRQVRRFARHVEDLDSPSLLALVNTATHGRDLFRCRAAVVADSSESLVRGLNALADGGSSSSALAFRGEGRNRPRVAFVFSGQGGQYPGMGRALLDVEPAFRSTWDRCSAVASEFGMNLTEQLHGHEQALRSTEPAQPLLFALEAGLVAVWRSWGVGPDVVIGHSVGEIAAATAAGVMSLEEGMTLACERGRAMQRLPFGSMASVCGDLDHVAAVVEESGPRVCIAAFNGPRHTVVSGESEAVAALVERLRLDGMSCRPLNVSHAFHSPMMQPVQAQMRHLLSGFALRRPRVDFVSTLTGGLVDHEVATADHWSKHVRRPVRFVDAVRALIDLEVTLCVEIGPGTAMTALCREILGDAEIELVSCLREHRNEAQSLAEAAARAYAHGVDLDWRHQSGEHGDRCVLPAYAWNHVRLELPRETVPVADGTVGTLEIATAPHLEARNVRLPLAGLLHRFRGVPIVPLAIQLTLMWTMARDVLGDRVVGFDGLDLERALEPRMAEGGALQVVIDHRESRVSLLSRPSGARHWTLLSTARLAFEGAECTMSSRAMRMLDEQCTVVVSPQTLYQRLRMAGYEHGPELQRVQSARYGPGRAVAELRSSADGEDTVDALVLDAAMQPILLARDGADPSATPAVPVSIGRVRIWTPPGRARRALVTCERDGEDAIAAAVLVDERGAAVAELADIRLPPMSRPDDSLEYLEVAWSRWQPPVSTNKARCLVVSGAGALPQWATDPISVIGRADFDVPTSWPASLELVDAVDAAVVLPSVCMARPGRATADLVDELARDCHRILTLALALGRTRLILLLPTHAGIGDARDSAVVASLTGLAATLALEHPELRCTTVELGPGTQQEQAAALRAIATDQSHEDRFRIADGIIEVGHVVRSARPERPLRPPRRDGAYLVTGASGALGTELVRWLLEQRVDEVVCTSRSASSSSVLQELRRRSSSTTVHLVDADVGRRDELRARLEPWLHRLRGIFHVAGVVEDATARHQSLERIHAVFSAKVAGILNLEEIAAASPLERFVVYSSITALLGSPGQANYTAANGFMDGLIDGRRRRGRCGQSVQWGPFRAGMAVQGARRTTATWQQGAFEPGRSLSILADVLQDGSPISAPIPRDFVHWFVTEHAHAALPRIAVLEINAEPTTQGWEQRLRSMPPEARLSGIEALVREQVAAVLGLDLEQVRAETNVLALGLDSLMVLELRNRVIHHLGFPVHVETVWEHPTPAELAPVLAAKWEEREALLRMTIAEADAVGTQTDELEEFDL